MPLPLLPLLLRHPNTRHLSHSPRPPPRTAGVRHTLCASQQGKLRPLTPAERRVQEKHRAHLAQTRFCPTTPGVPPPFAPWNSCVAAGTKSGSVTRSLNSNQIPGPSQAQLPIDDSRQHAMFFPQMLRPYHGSPMRLLGAMTDGKRRTSDLVKCIRAGQVDSMALSLALQLPDGFQAVNATRIQSNFRGRRVRREFLVRKNAAVKMQATMRGNLWRSRLRDLSWNALWIQAVWRSRKTGWRPWMRRSPMRIEQLHQAATLIEATSRMRKQQRGFLHRKQAATTIQRHVRGRQGRALHKEWLAGDAGPAALAKNRERLMLAMKQAAELLEDTGMGSKQPAKALEGYMTVYNQAASSEVSCGVPQLSKVAVKREMRGKMRTIQEIYAEFVSSSGRAR